MDEADLIGSIIAGGPTLVLASALLFVAISSFLLLIVARPFLNNVREYIQTQKEAVREMTKLSKRGEAREQRAEQQADRILSVVEALTKNLEDNRAAIERNQQREDQRATILESALERVSNSVLILRDQTEHIPVVADRVQMLPVEAAIREVVQSEADSIVHRIHDILERYKEEEENEKDSNPVDPVDPGDNGDRRAGRDTRS